MSDSKLWLYTCYECSRCCSQVIRDDVENVENVISGYDDINDCEYYYVLEGEYKER